MSGKENMARAIVLVSLPGLSEAEKHSYIQMSVEEIILWFLERRIPSQKRDYI